jgi:hypothetical protein
MNTNPEPKLSPEKRVELLTQLTSALLATGHFTYMQSNDHPSLRYGTHHKDEGKEIFTSHVLDNAETLLDSIIESVKKTTQEEVENHQPINPSAFR